MGVKSTQTITRNDAIRRILEIRARRDGGGFNGYSNRQLGDLLEQLLDEEPDWGGYTNFDNFNVVNDGDDDAWR